jgi:hypothetical protein
LEDTLDQQSVQSASWESKTWTPWRCVT